MMGHSHGPELWATKVTRVLRGNGFVAEGGFPPVLDDFMGRLIHMCYGKTWAMKFGGALAMLILGGK